MYARVVVKAVKKNSGRKPVLRKLTSRIERYGYRLDLESRTLVLKVHNSIEARLKLLLSDERVRKFKGWSNYEIAVKFIEN